MQALEGGGFNDLVDLRLGGDYNSSEMAQMVACAAVCVRSSARRRPLMSQVNVLGSGMYMLLGKIICMCFKVEDFLGNK